MTAAAIDTRVVGGGLVALGLASAIAVVVDASSPHAAAAAALLGVASGLGLARLRRGPRSAGRAAAPGPRPVAAGLGLVGIVALAWLLIGAAAASALDAAGTPKRAELFALTDGLMVAVGLLLLRASAGGRRLIARSR